MKISKTTEEFLRKNCQIDNRGIVTCFQSINEEIIAAVKERVLDLELEFVDEYEIERDKQVGLTAIPNDSIPKSVIQQWEQRGFPRQKSAMLAVEDMDIHSQHSETRRLQLNEFRAWFKNNSFESFDKDENKVGIKDNVKFYLDLLNWQRKLLLYPSDGMGANCVAVLKEDELSVKTTTIDNYLSLETDNNHVILSVMALKNLDLGNPLKWNAFLYEFLSKNPEGANAESIIEAFKKETRDPGVANLPQKVTELNDKLKENGFSYLYRIQAKKLGNKVEYYYIPYFKNTIVLDVNSYKTLWDKACEGDEAAIEQICDMNSEFRIGFCYEFGSDIVPQDINKAKEWFERAVKKGHPTAIAHLAKLLSDEKTVDGSRVVELYTKSAELGCSIAQYHLGLLYKEGKYVEKDMTKAVSLFERCAEQDDKEWCVADAAKELSEYYAESDPDKATIYLSKYFKSKV